MPQATPTPGRTCCGPSPVWILPSVQTAAREGLSAPGSPAVKPPRHHPYGIPHEHRQPLFDPYPPAPLCPAEHGKDKRAPNPRHTPSRADPWSSVLISLLKGALGHLARAWTGWKPVLPFEIKRLGEAAGTRDPGPFPKFYLLPTQSVSSALSFSINAATSILSTKLTVRYSW
jgi:hypothetical protein